MRKAEESLSREAEASIMGENQILLEVSRALAQLFLSW